MGLIGSLLAMLYCGGSGVYLSPIAFILNPCLWLLLASTYKATHLQGPNFAYALVLRRFATFPAKEKLALQSIQHIFDAAEPIVVSTVKQFIETFAPYGLRRDAMTGGYGLAESCVYVCDGGHQAFRSVGRRWRRRERWRCCVCGRKLPTVILRVIVDLQRRLCWMTRLQRRRVTWWNCSAAAT